jgi:ABC-type branched-subunit amino acid transport system ATPase component
VSLDAAATSPGRVGHDETAALEVIGLTVTYGGLRAVDDVSFTVAPGKILGLIGPNGAGKTTVLDAICGLVPAVGRVWLGNRDVSGLSAPARARAGLGRSFQDAKLFPSLTVYENLCLGSERHIRAEGVISTSLSLPWVRKTERRVARRAEELIELMGLGAFRDKFVSELSTGSRRIVDLAMILAHEPTVLLLDEPSSGIAQRETEALGPMLRQLREATKAAMLLIEHDMPLISSVADELLALETGSVLVRGASDVVLADPRLVSAYLGTNESVIARSGSVTVETNGNGTGRAPAAKRAASPASAPRKAPARRVAAAKTATAKNATTKKATAKRAAAVKTATKRAAPRTPPPDVEH